MRWNVLFLGRPGNLVLFLLSPVKIRLKMVNISFPSMFRKPWLPSSQEHKYTKGQAPRVSVVKKTNVNHSQGLQLNRICNSVYICKNCLDIYINNSRR